MATDDHVRLAYRWAELLPTDEPNRELVAAVSGADVRYFTAKVVGSENGKEWQASSWVERAYRKGDGGFRVLWKSGVGDTPELPGAIVSDWSAAQTRDDAIAQFFDRQRSRLPARRCLRAHQGAQRHQGISRRARGPWI